MPGFARFGALLLSLVALYVVSGDVAGTVHAQTFTISGRVTEPPSVTGTPISGVSMVLTINNTMQSMTQTDGAGNFSFPNVPAGSDYDVTPSKPSFTFNPINQGGSNIQADRTLFFTGTMASNATIQFAAVAPISEADRDLLVTVTRTGDPSAPASADYATSDNAGSNSCNFVNGAASSRCDYLTTVGTVTFGIGETSKVISIPIVDDVYAEGGEDFAITLSNPVGATLGAPATQTLHINDNDAVNGTSNPIDDADLFVRQHYVDFLNREPDPGGMTFWSNEIRSCGADTQCRDIKRVNVSAAFFLSIEFQETGYLVYRIYKTAFGVTTNVPVPVRFSQFLRDTQRIGQGVQVGIGNWEAQLAANKQAYALAFVQRPEFALAFPVSMTAQEIVAKMNSNAGGVLSASEISDLEQMLIPAPSDVARRASVLRAVAEDADLRSREFNRAFVLMQYFGYMRRNPDDAPDADFGGYNFWLAKLNSFGGDFVAAEMVKAFVVSGEYRHRFGP